MSSLKCWLNKIEKQDKISKEDLNDILTKLEGHDEAIRADERRKFAEWFKKSNYYLCYSDTIDDAMTEYIRVQMEGVQE